MIGGLFIVLGVFVMLFGWYVIRKSADPLGYFPPLAALPMIIGSAMVCIGIAVQVFKS